MRIDTVGYYEIYGFNHSTGDYDKWLGTATIAAAILIGARVGGFVGHDKGTSDGWACKTAR
jgi:hypothetical protein